MWIFWLLYPIKASLQWRFFGRGFPWVKFNLFFVVMFLFTCLRCNYLTESWRNFQIPRWQVGHKYNTWNIGCIYGLCLASVCSVGINAGRVLFVQKASFWNFLYLFFYCLLYPFNWDRKVKTRFRERSGKLENVTSEVLWQSRDT